MAAAFSLTVVTVPDFVVETVVTALLPSSSRDIDAVFPE
jgi:hypothetical protein